MIASFVKLISLYNMEKILHSGVDLKGMYGKSFSGDSHFFDDAATPAKIRQYLDSSQVILYL